VALRRARFILDNGRVVLIVCSMVKRIIRAHYPTGVKVCKKVSVDYYSARLGLCGVIASEAKQSSVLHRIEYWIASLRSQ